MCEDELFVAEYIELTSGECYYDKHALYNYFIRKNSSSNTKNGTIKNYNIKRKRNQSSKKYDYFVYSRLREDYLIFATDIFYSFDKNIIDKEKIIIFIKCKIYHCFNIARKIKNLFATYIEN